MIEYHNPQAETGVEITPYQLRASISGANQVSVGFLANGFPDSDNFLDELQAVLKARQPGIAVHAWNKGNASIPAGPELLGEIRDKCEAVIAAYGH
ncbi:MAG: UGSC family (seleno)protein [Pseudomonadales bacterium]